MRLNEEQNTLKIVLLKEIFSIHYEIRKNEIKKECEKYFKNKIYNKESNAYMREKYKKYFKNQKENF